MKTSNGKKQGGAGDSYNLVVIYDFKTYRH